MGNGCKTRTGILLTIFTISILTTAWVDAKTPRILMVGDSWAWFMYLNRSLRDALEKEGLGEFEEVGLFTTVPGSEASQWIRQDWLDQVRRELSYYPTIDIIHLSIGGNDFLRRWRIDMPDEEKEQLFQEIVNNTEKIIRELLMMRPNLRVALVEYDFINKSKGKATCQELNRAGTELSKRRMEMCKNIDRCRYIQTYGLMQYHFGAPPDLPPHNVPLPGQFPYYQPFPGGNIQYCNDSQAMMDNVHLSGEGYYLLALHCVKLVYKEWLLNPIQPTTDLISMTK